MKQKRLLTIQDLSCFGKCSLTAAIPVASAMGIETVVLPTAVLSTHTGEFNGYTFHSLEGCFEQITTHWKKEKIEFDAIHIGYIGSKTLIEKIKKVIDDFRGENTFVYIDPAMADNGSFYSGLDEEYAKSLSLLCKKADIISPNLTEALILAGKSPAEIAGFEDENTLLHILKKYCPTPIITGIHKDKKIATAVLSGEKIFVAQHDAKDGVFYGTGDLFAAALAAMCLCGIELCEAVKYATDFVNDCIEKTLDEREKYWYGLKFEQSLGFLTDLYRKTVK